MRKNQRSKTERKPRDLNKSTSLITSAESNVPSRLFSALGRKTGIHLLIVTVAVLIGYSNTLHSPFVFDDSANIVDNALIKDLDNFTSLEGHKLSPRRFIGYLSFALNYHVGGLDVTGYHVVNIAIHCINALLVYVLVILTLKTPYLRTEMSDVENRYMIALFSALLFAAHPVQTQAVTYIVQRFTSLATLFYLLSVVLYVKARLLTQTPIVEANRGVGKFNGLMIVGYLSSVISALLAMKTKEIAFTLPLVIALYDFVFFHTSSFRQRALYLIPVLLTLAIIPLSIMGTDMPAHDLLANVNEQTRVQTTLPRWDYGMTQMRVIATYIRLLFLPVHQNIDYDYPLYHSIFEPEVLLSFLFLAALIGYAVYCIYRSRNRFSLSRVTAYGILWFFIALSVESGIIPIVDVIFEHRIYLPSVGAFIAISTSVWLVNEKMKTTWHVARNIGGPAMGFVVIALLATTYLRNSVWTDKVSLWEDSVSKSPKADGYTSLGLAYAEKNEIDAALEAYGKAISLAPKDPKIYINLAVAYSKAGAYEKAIEANRKAILLNPNGFEAYNNLGEIYYSRGRIEDAIREYQRAVALNPGSAPTYNNIGAAYWSLGLFDKAIEQYTIAIQLKPDYADAYNNIGIAYGSKGMLDAAIENFQRALQIQPDHAGAHGNLSIAYEKKGMLQQSGESGSPRSGRGRKAP